MPHGSGRPGPPAAAAAQDQQRACGRWYSGRGPRTRVETKLLQYGPLARCTRNSRDARNCVPDDILGFLLCSLTPHCNSAPSRPVPVPLAHLQRQSERGCALTPGCTPSAAGAGSDEAAGAGSDEAAGAGSDEHTKFRGSTAHSQLLLPRQLPGLPHPLLSQPFRVSSIELQSRLTRVLHPRFPYTFSIQPHCFCPSWQLLYAFSMHIFHEVYNLTAASAPAASPSSTARTRMRRRGRPAQWVRS
jgi:hypothetical protein